MTKRLSPERIAETYEMLKPISPTPWFFNTYSAVFSEPLCTEDAGTECCVATVEILKGDTATAQGRKNAEFIAQAPERIRELLGHIEAVEADREALGRKNERIKNKWRTTERELAEAKAEIARLRGSG